MSVISIGALFFFLLVALGVLTLFAWIVVTLVNRSGKDTPQTQQESKLMQELYEGLSKMETRMEALETILLERESKRDK